MTFLRGSLIGIVVGLVPGAGATIASFVSYGAEMQYGRRKDELGTGIPEGIIAPQTAATSSVGGALIPLVTMGIPGSGATAIILGAFLLHGLQPGPQVFASSPEIIYAMFASLFVGIVVMCVIGYFAAKLMVKVLDLPEAIVSAYVVMCCFLGAYASRNNVTDLWLLAGFGIVGYLFERFRFPITPLVLGVILGPLAETSFMTTMVSFNNDWTVFFTRPVSGVLMVMACIALIYPLVRHRMQQRKLRREHADAPASTCRPIRRRARWRWPSSSASNLYRLEVPLDTPYKLAFGPVTRFDTILVEAQDDDGRIGLGEATLLTGYTDETIDGAWELMQRLAAGFPGLAPERCVELAAGVVEAAPFAATGLTTAMEMLQSSSWLRVNEATRVPLLGVVNGSEARELEVEVARLLDEGFGTLKVKVGFDADQDARRVRLIQRIVAGRCLLRSTPTRATTGNRAAPSRPRSTRRASSCSSSPAPPATGTARWRWPRCRRSR